jgi:hypothetical protein
MEHISFDIICRLADDDMDQSEMAFIAAHLKSCQSCQREVDLQRSITRASGQAPLVNPSHQFTQNVLERIAPSQKKKWYEWMLHNMGNIFAMSLVLGFLGYVLSVTGTAPIQNDKTSKIEPMLGFLKVIQDNSHQFGSYLMSKFTAHTANTSQTHASFFALLAIILLVFIDKIAGYFFQRSRI